MIPNEKILYLNGTRLKLSGTVTIPASVTKIKNGAFSGCTELTSITIPDNVTSIGESAFSGCRGLTNISIGRSVEYIGDYAFSGCSGLTSVTIPESVTSIRDGAFCNCAALKELIIANGNTTLNFTSGNSYSRVFAECPLEKLYLGRSFKCWGTSPFRYLKTLVSLEIGKNAVDIPTSAFSYCTGLTSITIPSTVTNIGSQAFYECSSLKEVIIQDGDTALNLLDDDTYTLFKSCPIETMYLGRNLNYEDNISPFYEKETLTTVEIGKNVTSIGESAFDGCQELKSITIPDSVTNIGDYAFCDCTSLTTVNYRGTETQWNAISIGSSNDSLTNATIIYNYSGE